MHRRSNRRRLKSIWSNQPQSFGDFHHGTYSRLHRPENQVNLLLLLLQEQGDLASTPIGDEEPYDMQETRSLANWKKHKLCLSIYYYNTTYKQLHRCNRKERWCSLQSILIDDNGTPATWTMVLSSSKPLTGRTGHQLRDASATGTTWRHHYSLYHRNTLPDKDSSQDDMPCRHPPPLRLHLQDTPTRHLARHLAGDFASHLLVFASHRSSRPPATTEWLLGKTNKWEPTSHSTVYPTWQPPPTQYHFHRSFASTPIQVQPSTTNRCEATGNHTVSMPVS